MSFDETIEENELSRRKKIEDAFRFIDRRNFVLEKEKQNAYEDVPLTIGYGQTISQPMVVAFMLNLLDLKEGERVLDVGSGSGWTTALLAFLVGKKGKVIAIETVPELYDFGRKNIGKYNFLEKGTVEVFCGDGKEGKKEKAPFDKILVSAATDKDLPLPLRKQLKTKGKAVIPIGSSIFLLTKEKKGFKRTEYPGFSFVPLI